MVPPFFSNKKLNIRNSIYTSSHIMSSRFSEVKKLISSINDRLDALCTKSCDELGLDKDKIFKELERRHSKKASDGEDEKKEKADDASKNDDGDTVSVTVDDKEEKSDDNDGWSAFFSSSMSKASDSDDDKEDGDEDEEKEDDEEEGDDGNDEDEDDDEEGDGDDTDDGEDGDDDIIEEDGEDDAKDAEIGEEPDDFGEISIDNPEFKEQLQTVISNAGIGDVSINDILKDKDIRKNFYSKASIDTTDVDDTDDDDDDIEQDTVDKADDKRDDKEANRPSAVDYDAISKADAKVQKELSKGWKSSDLSTIDASSFKIADVIKLLKRIEKEQRRTALAKKGKTKDGIGAKVKKVVKTAVKKGVGAINPTAGQVAGVLLGESVESCHSLYDRARCIFERGYGINESVDGYNFDDYVAESKIDNGILTRERTIDESAVFYGYSMVMESLASDDEEFQRLVQVVTQGGDELKLSDLRQKSTDDDSVKRAKKRLLQLISKGTLSDRMDFNAKEAKKALELSTRPGGKLTDLQLWHKGLDDTGTAIENGLSHYLIPQEVTRALNIPKNIGRALGTGLGAVAFGPVGAIAGTALANWLANNHEKYKAKQYARLHGGQEPNIDDKMSRYTGSLVGAGLGTLLGGPAGGIIGAGLGHLGQKGYEFLKSKLGGNSSDTANN